MTKSILIVGVGGQGTLLASRIIGNAATSMGYEVKVSEVHGMSQRGGSVETYVKYGEKVYSPIIGKCEADIILAFEQLEAYRALPFLKKGGKIITNTQEIDSMPIIMGNAQYPENIIGKIKDMGIDIVPVDALSLAEKAGSAKAVNVVLLGVLAKNSDIPEKVWLDAVISTVPAKFADLNEAAFKSGYEV